LLRHLVVRLDLLHQHLGLLFQRSDARVEFRFGTHGLVDARRPARVIWPAVLIDIAAAIEIVLRQNIGLQRLGLGLGVHQHHIDRR
jgi:hypothetical protein